MATERLFGEDQFAIDGDFKLATCAGDEFPIPDEVFYLSFTQDLLRQTDGTRCVVSGGAVFDGDVHEWVLHDDNSLC